MPPQTVLARYMYIIRGGGRDPQTSGCDSWGGLTTSVFRGVV